MKSHAITDIVLPSESRQPFHLSLVAQGTNSPLQPIFFTISHVTSKLDVLEIITDKYRQGVQVYTGMMIYCYTAWEHNRRVRLVTFVIPCIAKKY